MRYTVVLLAALSALGSPEWRKRETGERVLSSQRANNGVETRVMAWRMLGVVSDPEVRARLERVARRRYPLPLPGGCR